MSNWFKTSWNTGIPIADIYEEGGRSDSTAYKGDPKKRTTVVPFLGGHKRDDYPLNTSIEEYGDRTETEKVREHLDGGNPLMYQDPVPTGEGVNKEEFVSPEDKRPKELSYKLDMGEKGPFNMHRGLWNSFRSGKARVPDIRMDF